MPFGTINGTGSRIFCPAVQAMLASPPRITGYSSRRYYTVIEQVYLGATCRNVLGTQDSYAVFALGEERRMEEDLRNAGG
jgi:hypothetical protein